MSEIKPTHQNDTEIDRPTCPNCGSRMWLSKITDTPDGTELRKFECPACEIGPGAG